MPFIQPSEEKKVKENIGKDKDIEKIRSLQIHVLLSRENPDFQQLSEPSRTHIKKHREKFMEACLGGKSELDKFLKTNEFWPPETRKEMSKFGKTLTPRLVLSTLAFIGRKKLPKKHREFIKKYELSLSPKQKRVCDHAVRALRKIGQDMVKKGHSRKGAMEAIFRSKNFKELSKTVEDGNLERAKEIVSEMRKKLIKTEKQKTKKSVLDIVSKARLHGFIRKLAELVRTKKKPTYSKESGMSKEEFTKLINEIKSASKKNKSIDDLVAEVWKGNTVKRMVNRKKPKSPMSEGLAKK